MSALRRAEPALFAAAVAVTAGSLFIPRLLPSVDYPQHLALADVARRLLAPGAPEHALFEVKPFTYYGLVQLVLGGLGAVMPMEIAGKVVLGGALVVTAWAARRLLAVLGRPPVYAALFVPLLYGFSASWGFLNYVVGLAIAFAAVALVASQIARLSRGRAAAIAALSLLCAMTHPLATMILWAFAGPLAIEAAARRERRAWPAARRAVLAALPAFTGAVWCAACVAVHVDPRDQAPALADTHAPVFWPKLASFALYATDLHADKTDVPIVDAMLGVMGAIALAAAATAIARRARRTSAATLRAAAPPPPLVTPFVVLFAAYLAMPMVFMGSQLMFPRLVPALVLAALLALPAIDVPWLSAAAAAACLTVAGWSALNLRAHFVEYAAETDDASRLIDALPPGRRASAVVYDDFTDAFVRGGVLHLAAWYAARKHGDWAYSFARYPYMPVRYREDRAPDWPEHGWEFDPTAYDVRSPYARTYDLVLVKTLEYLDPIDDEPTVRARVFKADAASPRLLAHFGLYWAFDTAGLARTPARSEGSGLLSTRTR
ncbi:MAG TPA: hypothetical protein VHV30_15670 [Polyangiaceae bacterium]|nr:hypothetical protein [Polyangiaceae bacterium]